MLGAFVRSRTINATQLFTHSLAQRRPKTVYVNDQAGEEIRQRQVVIPALGVRVVAALHSPFGIITALKSLALAQR